MATFLHRLCLFGVLAATGFALSNCQSRMDAEDRDRDAVATADDRETDAMAADFFAGQDQTGVGGAGTAGMGSAMDGGMKQDAGMSMDAGSMDGGTRQRPDARRN